MAIKDSIKQNYAKNPKAVTSVAVLGGAAVAAVIGVLTGIVEPDAAMSAISKLVTALFLGI